MSLGIGGGREKRRSKNCTKSIHGSNKKVEKLSDEKLSEVCQTGGYRKLGHFKW